MDRARQQVSFACSIRHQTPLVMNQKEEGICEIVALNDMVETVERILIPAPDLSLSPQVLLDAKGAKGTLQDAVNRCKNKRLGLESLCYYPFVRYARTIKKFKERNYQMCGHGRHVVDDINYVEKLEGEEALIKESLLGMFRDGGSKLPCVGGLHLGPLSDRHFAAQFSPTNPYRHAIITNDKDLARELYGDPHAVLIVGVDTTSENPSNHSVEIKNCYGTKWGKDGFCWVSFDVFDYLLIPVVKKGEDHP